MFIRIKLLCDLFEISYYKQQAQVQKNDSVVINVLVLKSMVLCANREIVLHSLEIL